MKKLIRFFLVLLLVLFTCSTVFASVDTYQSGSRKGEAIHIDFNGATVSYDGNTAIVYTPTWGSSGQYRQVFSSLNDWVGVSQKQPWAVSLNDPSGKEASPYYVNYALTQAQPGTPCYIMFPGFGAAGSRSVAQTGSPISWTFRIPDDYRTTATFVVVCQNAQSSLLGGVAGSYASTPNYISWDLVVMRSGYTTTGKGTTIQSLQYPYKQTDVALVAGQQVQNVTLTYATPSDLVAGDLVTVRIWRAYGNADAAAGEDSTADLYVFGVGFRYLAQW